MTEEDRNRLDDKLTEEEKDILDTLIDGNGDLTNAERDIIDSLVEDDNRFDELTDEERDIIESVAGKDSDNKDDLTSIHNECLRLLEHIVKYVSPVWDSIDRQIQ